MEAFAVYLSAAAVFALPVSVVGYFVFQIIAAISEYLFERSR